MLSKKYKSTRELLGALMEGGEAVKRDNPRGNETSYFFMVPKAQSPTGEEVINVPDGVDPQAFKAAGYKVPETASTGTPNSGLSSMNAPTSGWGNTNTSSSGWGSSTSGFGSTQSSGFGTQNPWGSNTGYGSTENTTPSFWGSTNSGLGSSSNSWGSNNGFGNGQNSLYTNSLSQSRLFGSNLSSLNNGTQGLNTSLYNTYLSPQIQLSDGVQVASNGQTAPANQTYRNSRGYQYWNTPARTQEELVDRASYNLEKSEKLLPYLYSDSKGNVTLATGLKVPNRRALDNYDLYREEEVNNPDAVPVGAAEKDALWNEITQYINERCGSQPLRPGETCDVPVGDDQEDLFGHLQMKREDAREKSREFLINNTLGPVKQSVRNAGFNWDDFSYPAQELFINGFYNEGKTPNSIRGGVDAIRRNDWDYICNAYINADIDDERAAHYRQLCNQQSRNPTPRYRRR